MSRFSNQYRMLPRFNKMFHVHTLENFWGGISENEFHERYFKKGHTKYEF